ncbi:MAG: energy-coupling factor ABC transporter permease [Candidatus Eisenbacteria bacterium]|nr:energy-coupling factor ABC transporter permease [Candidatus Eisenbacteria bacterium]
MHIPDGFLDLKTTAVAGALSATGLAAALRRIRTHPPVRREPMIGLAAAFIFVAQMLNFPVLGGTSGHLIGGVLAAVVLGPEVAVVVMSCVLILQCLLFADGGLLALGANIWNLAIVAPTLGYAIHALTRRLLPGLRGRLLATAFAAWCSVVFASISCAALLALSGAAPWRITLPAMVSVHMVIGFGEALITALVLAAVARTRPELLPEGESERAGADDTRRAIGYGLAVACGLAAFVAPFASPLPDGLERVAERLGFADRAATTPLHNSPFPDYLIPGANWSALSTVIAGLAGAAVAFAFAYLLARMLTPRSGSRSARDSV